MARTELNKADGRDWPFTNPWPPLIAGLALALLALLLPRETGTAGVLARVVAAVVGLLAAGAAVSLRLRYAGPGVEERAKSAGIVALAALVPLLTCAAMDEAWDSIQMILGVMTAVGVGGAVLVLLPSLARRVVISLLVLFHFGGIVTAITSVPPPGADAPWLTTMLWSRVYRPYLQFMYLNNAYHFYSPEPGPPTLLWFHLDYSDGSDRWVRLPEREQFATRQEYQRRLALTESTNMLIPPIQGLPRQVEDMRIMAGRSLQPPIPPHPQMTGPMQFRIPTPYSRLMVEAYARHVGHNYPSEKDPAAEVTRVKVYRVIHSMLTPEQLKDQQSPTDPTTYLPYYQGTFDKEGHLKSQQDPFLFWVIPIIWVPEKQLPKDFPEDGVVERKEGPDGEMQVLVDYTRIHARSNAETFGLPAAPGMQGMPGVQGGPGPLPGQGALPGQGGQPGQGAQGVPVVPGLR